MDKCAENCPLFFPYSPPLFLHPKFFHSCAICDSLRVCVRARVLCLSLCACARRNFVVSQIMQKDPDKTTNFLTRREKNKGKDMRRKFEFCLLPSSCCSVYDMQRET